MGLDRRMAAGARSYRRRPTRSPRHDHLSALGPSAGVGARSQPVRSSRPCAAEDDGSARRDRASARPKAPKARLARFDHRPRRRRRPRGRFSNFIRDHIEAKRGIDLDAASPASGGDRLDGRAGGRGTSIRRPRSSAGQRRSGELRQGPGGFFTGRPDAVREAGRVSDGAQPAWQGFGQPTRRGTGGRCADLAARAVAGFRVRARAHICWASGCAGADATVFGGLAAALSPHFDTPRERRWRRIRTWWPTRPDDGPSLPAPPRPSGSRLEHHHADGGQGPAPPAVRSRSWERVGGGDGKCANDARFQQQDPWPVSFLKSAPCDAARPAAGQRPRPCRSDAGGSCRPSRGNEAATTGPLAPP